MYEASAVVAIEEDVFIFPASFAQQRLWFLDQLQPGDHTYNLPIAVRLRGQLDVAALARSLNEVVQRHESLRTTFTIAHGEPAQVVCESLHLDVPVLDLRAQPEAEREAEFQVFAAMEAEKSFDLARGPLMRAVVVRLNDDDHVLLLTLHHIIFDGWSMSVLIGEVTTLYTALVSGQAITLPELPIQYADYSVWQKEWLQGAELERQLSYWKQKLDGSSAPVKLPADRPRPPVRSFRSASQSLQLDETLSETLRVLSRRHRVTLFMTLLTAFKILLSRYTGQDDIVVGSPIAGRNRAETKGVIGFFLNTLVLRTDLSGTPTFREVLERVRDTTLDAYSHQDVPFEALLEELQPERDLSQTPLFQVFFNMMNLPMEEVQLPDLKVEFLSPPEVGAKFDLTLYVREFNQQIAFEAVYNADLYLPERVTEMLSQLEHVLSQVVAQPEQQIDRLSLVTPSAEKVLPNPTGSQCLDWEGAVHELFSRQAARVPERLAVRDRYESWNYKELDEWSNRLANHLRAQGVKNGDVVAIYAHRSSSLVWVLLGVMKAGAAFLVLDPAYPASRLVEYLEIAEPAGLICLEAAGSLPDSLAQFVSGMSCCAKLVVASRHHAPEQQPLYSVNSPGVTVGADDLAYLSFTSGSTGKPKAVEGRHGPLTHFLPWFQNTFGLNENDRFSMVSGLSHDPLQRDVFFPLMLGASVCIPEQGLIETQGKLAQWMNKECITVANLTPAMGQLLVATEPGTEPLTLMSLRYTFLVGDVLTKHDAASLKKLAPAMTCINLYGATETQRAVSYFVVPDENIGSLPVDSITVPRAKEILPLGKGIEDVQLLLLNNARQLAGVGEIGEIYMRSPHVARGYRGDEALTREKFLSNPFTDLSGDRLYRTGDLGRYLPDGNVESLGRADLQVKIRGFRIEPGEIEALLRNVPNVREAVVIAREDQLGEKRLVAYLVAEPGTELASQELREYLKQKVPNYMVPSAFVMMDALPLTPNMKVNRRALPPPAESHEEFDHGSIPARTRLEKRLVEIWSEVLKLERCGVEDNFFDLGGHSLLAIQLQARVRQEFQVDVPLRRMFETPTVAGIAQYIETLRTSENLQQSPPLQRADRSSTLPLSFAQRRLWFLNELEPNNPFYNINTLLQLSGTLDVEALEKTLNEIVSRHEVLRTNFRISGEQPAQVIAAELTLKLKVLDLRDLPGDQREAESLRLATEEASRPFDLAQGSLLRAYLIRLADQEQVLGLTTHHIISDGWSIGVLAHEVAVLYRAFTANQPAPLPDLPIQYADFAVWQSQWLQTEALTKQVAYWKRQLADLPLLKLMNDKVAPAVPTYRGAASSFLIDKSLAQDLKQLSRREGVTLFMTLLAAFQVLLHRHSGQEDIVVGTDIANRHPVETEKLIGFFVNQLVLRTDLGNNPTFRDLLHRVQDVTLEGYDNQDLPFDKLVEILRPDRSRSRTPLFQAKLVLQNAPIEPLALPGLTLRQLNLDQEKQTAKFDLLLTFVELDQELSVSLEYSTDLFDAATIERLWRRFVSLAHDLVVRPGARLSEFENYIETENKERQMDQTETRVSTVRKFKKIQPKAVNLAQGELVKKTQLSGGSAIPLVIEPQTDILDLAGWVAHNWQSVEADLYKHGALLFRGFQVPDQVAFQSVVKATSVPLMQYMEGATPRTELGGKVYTSTEYPADQSIALHNELTYVMSWPMKIWFYCLQPAQEQGETPIADMRNVLRRLDPKIVKRFAEKGWLLVRNFGEGLSLPWQTSFHRNTRPELEAYCREARIEWQWKTGDDLQTRQRRPAIATHPVRGEQVWFNHIAFWHISSLESQLREAMLNLFGEENLAYNTYYGDGSRIEDSVVAEIRAAYRQETVAFLWQHGDILMLDNMLVAHGRSPFVGPRKVLVAMGEAYTRSDF
jgi:amino acid adenylation domain-containing protein